MDNHTNCSEQDLTIYATQSCQLFIRTLMTYSVGLPNQDQEVSFTKLLSYPRVGHSNQCFDISCYLKHYDQSWILLNSFHAIQSNKDKYLCGCRSCQHQGSKSTIEGSTFDYESIALPKISTKLIEGHRSVQIANVQCSLMRACQATL